MMIQEINMVGRERLTYLYGLYCGYAENEENSAFSPTYIEKKGIYQKIASEIAWCLGVDESVICRESKED